MFFARISSFQRNISLTSCGPKLGLTDVGYHSLLRCQERKVDMFQPFAVFLWQINSAAQLLEAVLSPTSCLSSASSFYNCQKIFSEGILQASLIPSMICQHFPLHPCYSFSYSLRAQTKGWAHQCKRPEIAMIAIDGTRGFRSLKEI